ncbi:MAG: histidine phosphatase family protein [Acidobacteria bacterium]|nr:histidine phosphatase family protein [Acidobacteriota bacterium]
MKIMHVAQRSTWVVCLRLAAILSLALFLSRQSSNATTALSLPQTDFKVTTVYLVRHAEKAAAPAADPPLTEAGTKRAEELARTLSKAGIKTICTSQFLRTKQTAEPLAKLLGITNTVIPVKMDTMNSRALSPQYLKDISDLVASSAGDVLIVGHSNTVPELIKVLGGDIVPTIDDATYDDLFVVTVYAKGKAKVAHLKQ